MAKQIVKSVTVKRPVNEIYAIWANFENFPYFMEYVEKVTKVSPTVSHWEVKGPLGMTVQWNAEMTRMDENKRIAWNSKDRDGTITTSGEVTFNTLPQNETEVKVTMQYKPPAGKPGEVIANIFSNPEERLKEDLRNFKRYAEDSNGRTATS